MSPTSALTSILYIDDEADMRMMAQVALESMGGFTVTLAPSGTEGIVTAKRNLPQLILLDAMMPGMDGPQTLRRIQEDAALSSIPVVFVTGRASAEDVAKFSAMGALGVIAKPFDPMTLALKIQKLWESRK